MGAEDFDDDDRIPERDDSLLTFINHSDFIYSCNLHPTEDLAVTGGRDYLAFVWNTKTAEIIFEVTNHKDRVIAVAFSYDGNYLATGDREGEIQVFEVHQDFNKVWEYSIHGMWCMKWHIGTNVLLAGSYYGNGEIYVWQIPSGDCRILPGHGKGCELADLTNDGKKLFAGYSDGSLKLWDIENSLTIVEINSDDPKDPVTSISCDSEESLYLSGSENGKILLINNFGVLDRIDLGDYIVAVSFCLDIELKVAASCTLQGQIVCWDVTTQALRTTWRLNERNLCLSLKWLPEQTLICGTCRGSIWGFDGRSGERKFYLQSHLDGIYDACFNERDNILLAISHDDNQAKIIKISRT